jgi:AcrR family transcriptional regulator
MIGCPQKKTPGSLTLFDKQALLDAVAAQGFVALRSQMLARMAKDTDPAARLRASGVGYVVFAVENPALFRLMFGGDGQQLSADAALTEARELAYGVLQASVAETSPDGTANPAHVPALMGIGTWDRQIDSRTRSGPPTMA